MRWVRKGKSKVHPIMGEGESADMILCNSDFYNLKHHKAVTGQSKSQSKSTSALPDNTSSKKSFRQRISSALSLSSKSKYKTVKNADSTDSKDIKSSESKQASIAFSPYLMDMGLEEIHSYRPKEGTYGKGKSVHGFKKGVREFGELLLDMCQEDILAYRSDCKYKVVGTPCIEEDMSAFLISACFLSSLGLGQPTGTTFVASLRTKFTNHK